MKEWIRSGVVAMFLAAGALAPVTADAALNAYLKLKGQKLGEIKGSVTQKGREGKIMVIAVSHEIVSPRDPQSGLPTGQRMHKPFVITKELDKSTPVLYKALVTNENLPEFLLEVYEQVGPAERLVYTVRLTNASVASIRLVEKDGKLAQELTFVYQRIAWTWMDGTITAEDDLLAK